MSRGRLRRLLCRIECWWLAALISGLSVSPAAAQSPLNADARVFTIAGGGTEGMQPGIPAGRLSLMSAQIGMPLAALSDGSVAVADDRGHPGLIGLDGRVRPLPLVKEGRRTIEVLYLAVETDGSLL